MTNPALVNVALTRCKRGLVIVGNLDTFSHDPIWARLIQMYDEKYLLKEWLPELNRFGPLVPDDDGNLSNPDSGVIHGMKFSKNILVSL